MQGWQADPFGLHEERYFSAGQPTKLVRDGGTETYDEPPAEASAAPEAAEASTVSLEPAPGAVSADAATVLDPAGEFDASHGAENELVPVAASGAAEVLEPGSAEPAFIADDDRAPLVDEALVDALVPRWPKAVLYGAAALVAVVVALAIVAITGGLSSRTPNIAGSYSGGSTSSVSGSDAGQSQAAPSTASSADVMSAAQRTLAQKTADVTVSGAVSGAGRFVTVAGSGQANFSANAMTATVGASYEGQAITEDEIVTGQDFYLNLAVAGRNPLYATSKRHWIVSPIDQAATANFTNYSLPWSLRLLEESGASVVAIGTRTIGGVSCTGYAVTPTKQAVMLTAQRQWTQLRFTQAQKNAALGTLGTVAPTPITLWINSQRELACQMNIDMQLSSGASTGSSPSASVEQVTVTFTQYGVPVHISLPPPSDSLMF